MASPAQAAMVGSPTDPNMVAEQVLSSTAFQAFFDVRIAQVIDQVATDMKEQSNLISELIKASHEQNSSAMQAMVKEMGVGIAKSTELKIVDLAKAIDNNEQAACPNCRIRKE